MYSLVSIPLYDTLGPEACCYVINQSEFTLSSEFGKVKLKVLCQLVSVPTEGNTLAPQVGNG